MKQHLTGCQECRQRFSDLEALFGAVADTSEAAAQWNFKIASQQMQRKRERPFLSFPTLTVGTAAMMALVLAVVSVMRLTPSARAESLLEKAAEYQRHNSLSRRYFSLTSNGKECRSSHQQRLNVLFNASFCDEVASRFQTVGWQWTEALSVDNFLQWRNQLKEREDIIHEIDQLIEISTRTKHSSLNMATLRLRDSDYEVMSGRFQFATNSGETSEFEITEIFDVAPDPVENIPQHISAEGSSKKPVQAQFDALDETEAKVRIALHAASLDGEPFLAIRRKDEVLEVWGIVSFQRTPAQVQHAIKDIPDVRLSVRSDRGHEDIPGSLPWQPYHGDGLPLAYDHINALFPNHPSGRQEYLNDLDAITRRIVGRSRNLDALLSLKEKVSPGSRLPLEETASGLQLQLSEDVRILSDRLQNLTGPLNPSVKKLNGKRAMELYNLIHEIAFLGSPGSSLTLEDALKRVQLLIQSV